MAMKPNPVTWFVDWEAGWVQYAMHCNKPELCSACEWMVPETWPL